MEKQELAKQGTGALAKAADVAPWQFEGKDKDDYIVPRISIHQGQISEKKYGKGELGSLIDTTTCDKLPSVQFVPIRGWKKFVAWSDELNHPPIYSYDKREEVPPADFQWTKDKAGKDIPPACTIYSNFAVLFDGMDFPVVLSMKSSDKRQATFAKLLNQLEEVRSKGGQSRGLYAVEVVDATNAKGDWKSWRLKPMGNPSAELWEKVVMWIGVLSTATIKTDLEDHPAAEPAAAQAEGFDPESFK